MKVYNTLSRKKEELIPIEEGKIRMYVCGPTVYNFFHIGNARPFVVFDTMRNYLEYKGMEVDFIQNFTDVDDKIINKAREEDCGAEKVAQTYIDEYFKDAQALNVRKATVHPRVSENIKEIIEFVENLIEEGYAYEVEGTVYYSAKKFSSYGKLSKQNIEELALGARIAVEEKKKDPLDFVLWKPQKEEKEIAWDSPWGKGRPGWHIECSTMAKKYLGETIDIHAGGQDLTFPHHENEIAQSEAHNKKTFANYWMHNGYITVDNEKMAKSKGNFFTVRDILKSYSGEVIRFFLLSGHYRNPINFSQDLMEQAENGLSRMENAKKNLEHLAENGQGSLNDQEEAWLKQLEIYEKQFQKAMDDDLNTADGLAAIFDLISHINGYIKDGCSRELAQKTLDFFLRLAHILGLLKTEKEDKIPQNVLDLVEERQEARAQKDFKTADEIRDRLDQQGYVIKDTPQGAQVIKK